ncbi:MAG: peptidylprolyl isomerase [Fimbriimonadaceae bacterium]|nr:peptidylprolyl isomerase [Fimbriimonadaceae bacterium]
MKRILTWLPVVGLMVVGCGGGGSGSAPVAIVNNDPVTSEEFNAYLARKRTVTVMGPQGPIDLQVTGSLGLQALRDMVNRKLLLQIAKDQGVAPTEDAVKKEIDFQQKRDPQFVKKLTGAGMSLEQINQDLKVDLARFNLVTKGITVTPADVDKYIKDNPQEFVTPAQVELYFIQVSSDKAKTEVDTALKQGTTFPIAASRYSEAPGARTSQGRFPITLVSELPPALARIVNDAKVGSPTNWVKDGQNWLRFFVQNKQQEKKISIDETIKEAVRRRIAEMRGGQANDLTKSLQERLKSATVEVKTPSLVEGWKQTMESLKASEGQAGAGNTP